MNTYRKSTKILLAVILTVLLTGIFVSTQLIDTIERNITTDYPVVYRDDLDRLLGRGWTVLGKEYGYTAEPFDLINTCTWEIGYKDIEGQEQTILISNFEDRSMSAPLGYCIERNFQTMAAWKYARDVIGPVIPAVCWEPEYWIRFLNYYVSGDHITDRPSETGGSTENPMAEVALRTYPLYSESASSVDWENPQSDMNLYDIDYEGLFRRKPENWYLIVFVDLSSWDISEEEYARKLNGMEETAEQILKQLNDYTDHSVNLELIFPSDALETGVYYHWYVINGELVDQTVSDWQIPTFSTPDRMYYKMEEYYHPKQSAQKSV